MGRALAAATLAAGHPTVEQEQRLREEAQRDLWAAVCAVEAVLHPEADRTFPERKKAGEAVLLTVPTAQVRVRQDGWYVADRGPLWITTRRLHYAGKKDVTIPWDKVSACSVTRIGGMNAVGITRWDREKPLYFVEAAGSLTMSLGAVSVQVPLDAAHLAELILARVRAS